jgi:hypothetical protein
VNKLIVWCGDSWTYGAFLGNNRKRINFAGIVSKELNVPYVNISQPGSSIGHLSFKLRQILQIKSKFPKHEIFVLFGLTYPGRFCVQNDFGEKITVGVNSFDICGFKDWASDVFSNQHAANESCLNLRWLADRCINLNINFKFYNILCSQQDLSHSEFFNYLDSADWIIDWDFNLLGGLYDLEKFDVNKLHLLERTSHGKKTIKEYFLEDKHPNMQGHKKIANIMLPYIQKEITK